MLSSLIALIAKATEHSDGDISMHRIGSELCHVARKGRFDRHELKQYNKIITPEMVFALQTLIPTVTGEDTGKHMDHTYRKIAKKMMTYCGII